MDWTERINNVVDYIENNLCNDIDENEICKIMGSTFVSFQNSFSQITGISFSEYVRRRKLTCAAYDLQNSNDLVIDIALKYGYESADAFRVAFKRLHGVTPTEVRKGNVKLTFYCRLKFKINIIGVDKMDYIITKKESFKVLGIRKTTPYGGGTWAIVKSDGSNEKIKNLSGKFFDLGLCFGFNEDGSNDYMCAVKCDDNVKDNVEGFVVYQYPTAQWIKFEAKGTVTGQTLTNVWNRINNEFLPQSKYRKSGLPTIEKYNNWDDQNDICDVDIWIPVVLK